jgi:hypothetical protein
MDEFNLSTGPIPEPSPKATLPRSAWSSQLAQLRILLRAKQALDQQEIEFFSPESKA